MESVIGEKKTLSQFWRRKDFQLPNVVKIKETENYHKVTIVRAIVRSTVCAKTDGQNTEETGGLHKLKDTLSVYLCQISPREIQWLTIQGRNFAVTSFTSWPRLISPLTKHTMDVPRPMIWHRPFLPKSKLYGLNLLRKKNQETFYKNNWPIFIKTVKVI